VPGFGAKHVCIGAFELPLFAGAECRHVPWAWPSALKAWCGCVARSVYDTTSMSLDTVADTTRMSFNTRASLSSTRNPASLEVGSTGPFRFRSDQGALEISRCNKLMSQAYQPNLSRLAGAGSVN